ncbi:MAG: ribosome maturation factor RimP [Deltaproteobacteria bacterium]|nr:ribosome maturation factor RimP [Deltaproteobacteria bacterium]
MDRAEWVTSIERVATPVVAQFGCELVDVKIVLGPRRWTVQLRIDRLSGSAAEAGVTIDDCARISRALSGVFDVDVQIPVAYDLEISSPGPDRPLKQRADYERFAGHTIEVRTREPFAGRNHWKGTLQGLSADEILLACETGLQRIPLAVVARTNLADPIVIGKRRAEKVVN